MRWTLVLLLVSVVGCSRSSTSRPSPVPSTNALGLPDSARAGTVLPLVPGVSDPKVTQANIHTTICVSGYTAKVRPAASYTDALKRQQMRAYHLSGSPSAYEEDHLVPLELGGSPTDPKNLWPEPLSQARPRDLDESILRRQVCNGTITLDDARSQITVEKHIMG